MCVRVHARTLFQGVQYLRKDCRVEIKLLSSPMMVFSKLCSPPFLPSNCFSDSASGSRQSALLQAGADISPYTCGGSGATVTPLERRLTWRKREWEREEMDDGGETKKQQREKNLYSKEEE